MATLVLLGDLAWSATAGRGGHVIYLAQWLHGLERLGHRVLFLELVPQAPTSEALRFYERTINRWWYPGQTALLLEKTHHSLFGLDLQQVLKEIESAAALITLAVPGSRVAPPLVSNLRPRILVDQDPGFSQLWSAAKDPLDIFGEHDFYFTVGGNVGSSRCRLPCHGISWRPLWNPVVLDWWQPSAAVERDVFTTVASWWSQGYLEFECQWLGPKSEEFRKFIDTPRLAEEPLEVIADVEPDHEDYALFQSRGWRFNRPELVQTASLYHDYITGSAGEFSCAKGVYVGTRCGWFSDRSSCFLAAGRPVVLQDTGFADLLPAGRGLFAVASSEQAAEALKEVRRDYRAHAAAARQIAVEHFDSNKILSRMLAEAGIRSSVPS